MFFFLDHFLFNNMLKKPSTNPTSVCFSKIKITSYKENQNNYEAQFIIIIFF
jgi:hypothetical protein